jgi:allantoinase
MPTDHSCMQKRYSYSPITRRPQFSWPDGRRLAVYVALNIESYRFGSGMIEELLPASPEPDVLNHSWCDYGNRVGIWRLSRLFDELNIPVTLLVNSDVYGQSPEVIEPFRLRGDEISCHGRTNSERQSNLGEDEERLLIEEATKAITSKEGSPPKGWLGPWISETYATPDLLKEAGYQYILDWCCDDQPVWMQTRTGPLLAVPYPQELNDSSSVIGRYVSASDFSEMIIDQFEEMLVQSIDEPLSLGIALHSHISGQPFRLRQLRRALSHIADRSRGHWLTRAGSIAEHFSRAVPATK